MDVHAYLEAMAARQTMPADRLAERLLGVCFEVEDEAISAIYRRAIHAAQVEHLALLRGRLKESVQ